MSIFPKRTIPGKGVTIHWNFNTTHLNGAHIFPFVRIGVKSPDGSIMMLYEGNVLALPDGSVKEETSSEMKAYKYLNKNTPLLVLADYLSGPMKREVLADILLNIQSGRHFYFYYPVSDSAIPGKYELISEVHSEGHIKYSKTAADDFFFVEKVEKVSVVEQEHIKVAEVKNFSAEKVPAKLVECFYVDKQLQTRLQVFEIPAHATVPVKFTSNRAFLLYNEEREVISLNSVAPVFYLRNQHLLSLNKNGEVLIMDKNQEEAFKLTGTSAKVWLSADGITEKPADVGPEYLELLQNGIIKEFFY